MLEEEKSLSTKSKNMKKTVLMCVVATIIVIAVGIFSYYAICASTDKIYDGVYVGTENLSGLDKNLAVKKIAKKYDGDEINVTLNCEDVSFKIHGSDIDLETDFEKTAEKALSYGKNGSIFSKIKNMQALKKNPVYLSLALKCNMDLLKTQIDSNLGDRLVPTEEYSVEIGDNAIFVSNGQDGRTVEASDVLKIISDAVTERKLSEPLNIKIKKVSPKKIDFEEFYKTYNRDCADASYTDKDGVFTIIPEIVGISFDKSEAEKIIRENTENPEKYQITAQITYPNVTAHDIEMEFTDTILGTYSSNYSGSVQNRKDNIALAASKINSLVLNPGEVFSFNEVVGARTEQAGYKMAHVYTGNKVTEGIGGGICQVSSTLYNAVVLADLEIVYRTNHAIPVSYVPLGRDATVSYGAIDFKFKNNKSAPIKIEAIANGSNITINVYGRKKYLKDISIETETIGTKPFSTTEIKDNYFYEDERKVEEEGKNGTVIQSYKIVKENGIEVSRTPLAKSTYIPINETIRVGTLKREPPTE